MSAPPRARLADAGALAVVLVVVAWVFAPILAGERIVAERDALSAVIPAKLFLARSLLAGEIPWWNPLPALGKPFYADPLAGVLSPGNLLLLVPPFARGYGLFLAGQYLWTACGAFLCLRAARLPPLAAAFGALVWALGGAMLSLANVVNHLSAAAWLPWVAYGWSRPDRVPRRIAAAAAAMTPIFLAGSPEMAAIGAAGLLLWACDWRALLVPPLAAGLAGASVLPMLAYTALSRRAAIAFEADEMMRFAATPAQLLQLAWPSGPLEPPTFLASVYVGPIALALALVALAGTSRRRALALAAGFATVVLIALGEATPVLPALVRVLPVAGLVRYPGKALVAAHALVACGAAFGLARLLAWAERRGRAKLARQAVASLLPLVALVALVQLLRAATSLLAGEPSEDVLSAPPIARAMLAESSRPPRYFSNTTGMPLPRDPAAALRLDRALLFAATGEIYGLGNVNTPSSLNLIAHEILQKALASAPPDRALDALAALGTEYVTSWVPLGAPAIEVPLGEGTGRLYRLPVREESRALLAKQVVEASDALGAAGRFVFASPGAHDGLAVLEVAAPRSTRDAAILAAIGRDARAAAGTVRVIESRASSLSLDVDAASPALLVVNDTWLPGWSATLDGAPVDILRVNGLVRGVALDAGAHRVEMLYRPPALAAGLLVSAASVLVVALLALAGRRRSRRQPIG